MHENYKIIVIRNFMIECKAAYLMYLEIKLQTDCLLFDRIMDLESQI